MDATTFSYPENVDLRGYKPTVNANPRQLEKAAKMILAARKPVIYVGGGATLSDVSDDLLKFAETIQAPVTTTLMGMASFPENPSAVDGHAGDARNVLCQYGGDQFRFVDCVGSPL